MTPEEEKRKEKYNDQAQAMIAATAVVFHNGNEDEVWHAVFKLEDDEQSTNKMKPQVPTAARMHLKSTH